MRTILAVNFCCLVLMSMGCSSLQPRIGNTDTLPSQALSSDTNQPAQTRLLSPSRIAVIWSNNVLKMPNKQPVRGFTGRIYFYDENDELLQVDGELTVYGYDDSQYKTSEVADHVYKFPPEYFAKHYNPSELGHSYAVWIPWPQEDRFRKSISLYPAFKTVKGQVLYGNISLLTLPGDKPPFENHVEKKIVKAGARANVGDSPTTKRPEVDQFNIPYGLAQKLSKQAPQYFPSNRIPPKEVLQHLTDMESNEKNPGGTQYNRTFVDNRQIGGKPDEEDQVSHNISDSSNLPIPFANRNFQVPPNPNLGAPRTSSFGKPGNFR